MKKTGWRLVLAAGVFLLLGLGLSCRVEPGIRVETLTLAGETPALRFLPDTPGPYPTALLTHGVTASKETLFRFGEALAAAGFECWAIDFPGHGASARPFAWRETVKTVEAAARAVGKVDVFLGHSMGSYAGTAAVWRGGFQPKLFIAVGALPSFGEGAPPLLLLSGRWDEAVGRRNVPAEFTTHTNTRTVVSSWSDHALEPYDPRLVNAAVEAACAAVGKEAPAGPGVWRWRLLGAVLGIGGALGLCLSLPGLPGRWGRARGLFVAGAVIATLAAVSRTWVGAAPVPGRIPVQIAITLFVYLVTFGLGRLRVPRWSFAALAGVLALGCLAAGAWFLALFVSLFSLVLLAGTLLGAIATCRGSRFDGDCALAIFVGYAIGQWAPRFF